jgi:hypothetical protein
MSKIITIFIALFFPVFIIAQGNLNAFFDEADALFAAYVKEGKADYIKLKENSDQLFGLINNAKDLQVTKTEPLKFQAYWINIYNLLVMETVVKNYPIASPIEVTGFFDKKKHEVQGGSYTLNEIENTILRKNFAEPRFHFVLVCGALGCPPIVNFAYRPEFLEKQLETQTKLAINNPDFIRVDDINKKVRISEIFKWYPEDFKKHSGNIISYINSYRAEKIPSDYSVTYYNYDWSLNLQKYDDIEIPIEEEVLNVQTYTPSSLLKKGQVEVQLFNNLYTQTAYRDNSGEKVELSTRDTYFTGLFYALYGITKSGRINVGFDVNFRSVRLDPNQGNSALKVFLFEDTTFARTGISSIGPKIKILPFKSVPNLSIQSSVWFNTAKEPEGEPWFDHDATTWWTRFYYDRMMGTKFQLFTEADALVRFSNISPDKSFVEIPLSVFVSYFPTSKSTIYTMIQYTPNISFEKTMYMQTGIGAKYQIFRNVGLEVSYTNFFYSKNNGAGSTFNLGIRYVR